MLLGGIRYLLPVIKAAHEQGYHVITADYLPDNIAHKFSDEYVNVSIIDKEAVLQVAREKKIDGIMSFGVDPGVISASYVQNQMGLPSFGPLESVEILQNKDRFRAFLTEHGFNVPKAKGYCNAEDVLSDADQWDYPVIWGETNYIAFLACLNCGLTKEARYTIEKFKNTVKTQFEKTGCLWEKYDGRDGSIMNVEYSAPPFMGWTASTYQIFATFDLDVPDTFIKIA